MFSKRRTSQPLFFYETKNYPDGIRKETRWGIGGIGVILLLMLCGLIAGVPINRIIEVVKSCF